MKEAVAGIQGARRAAEEREKAANEQFENSEFLRNLKEKSDANKDQRRREQQDKYCRRQAELGVGDCAGLRLIPGATKSGRQKPPKALMDAFGLTDDDYAGATDKL